MRSNKKAVPPHLHRDFGVIGEFLDYCQARRPQGGFVEEVLGFSTSVGLPVTLGEVGLVDLPRDLLRRIAERATAEGETIHNEPFDVGPAMVEDAILAADANGRAFQERRV